MPGIPVSTALPPEAEQRLEQFEEAWQSGQPPALEPFLGGGRAFPEPVQRQLLFELVKIDLEYRWRRKPTGNPWALNDYLQRWPRLGPREQLPAGLIAHEYYVRQRWGDRPGQEAYLKQFPAQAGGLRAALAAMDAELALSAAAGTPAAGGSLLTESAPAGAARPAASVPDMLDALRQTAIIRADHLKQLILDDLQGRFPDSRTFARQLLERDWLTPYQTNQLVLGRGRELVLGQYVLLERLGEGVRGQIFKAQHLRMQRTVALKIIPRDRLADPQTVNRFKKEVQAASQLTHPHVVHALDAGPVGSTYFLAMEYVQGIDLARLLKQTGPLPVAQACDYVRQAALGLECIAANGLVHRDIKPSNLIVIQKADSRQTLPEESVKSAGPWGLVKILDLGLARVPQAVDEDSTSQRTQQGTVMGTPDYMAPEQAMDPHAVDVRADLYSLGCTFYHLLTGKVPFPGGTLFQKVDRHRYEEPPPVEQLRPEAPASVAAVVRKLMAKRPQDRYQAPGELSTTLESLLASGNLPAVPAPRRLPKWLALPSWRPRWSRRRWLTLAGSGAAVLAGSVLWGLLRPRSTRLKLDVIEMTGYRLRHEAAVRSLTFNADGSLLYSGDDKVVSAWDIFTGRKKADWQLGGGPALTGTLWGMVSSAEASLAVELLAEMQVDGENRMPVQVWNLAAPGKPQLTLFTGSRSKLLAVSPNGKMWGWTSPNGTFNLGGAKYSSVNNIPRGLVVGAFAPDNKSLAVADKIVYLCHEADPNRPWQARLNLTGHSDLILFVTYSADGKLLATGGKDRTVIVWNLLGGKPLHIHKIQEGLPLCAAFAPDGQLLACGSSVGKIKLWDVTTGQELATLEGHAGPVNSLAFAPKEKLLASASQDKTVKLWKSS